MTNGPEARAKFDIWVGEKSVIEAIHLASHKARNDIAVSWRFRLKDKGIAPLVDVWTTEEGITHLTSVPGIRFPSTNEGKACIVDSEGDIFELETSQQTSGVLWDTKIKLEEEQYILHAASAARAIESIEAAARRP